MSKLLTLLMFATAVTIGCTNEYNELAAVTEAELSQAESELDTARTALVKELGSGPPAKPNSPAWHEYWASRPEAIAALREKIDVAKTKYDDASAEHEKSIVLRDSLHSGITFMEASQMVEQYQREYDKAYAEFDSYFDEVEAMDLSTVNTPQEYANIDAKANRFRDAKDAAEAKLRRAIAIRDVLRPSID